MNIQPINQQVPNTNFKAVYPVRHCIDYGDKVVPITYDMKTIRNLQGTFIRILNKKYEKLAQAFNEIRLKMQTGKKLTTKEVREKQKLESALKIRNIIGSKECSHRGGEYVSDADLNKEIRSYYNTVNGDPINGTWTTFAISGKRDITDFENIYAKELGRNKRDARIYNDNLHNGMLESARDSYLFGAYHNFINDSRRRLKASDGTSCYLNIVWKPVLNKDGKIMKKGRELVDYYPVSAEFKSTGKTHP